MSQECSIYSRTTLFILIFTYVQQYVYFDQWRRAGDRETRGARSAPFAHGTLAGVPINIVSTASRALLPRAVVE